MSEYTPTTAEMRAFYTAERLDGPHLEGLPEPTANQAESEFDRWFESTQKGTERKFPPSYVKDAVQARHELWTAATSTDTYMTEKGFREVIAAIEADVRSSVSAEDPDTQGWRMAYIERHNVRTAYERAITAEAERDDLARRLAEFTASKEES